MRAKYFTPLFIALIVPAAAMASGPQDAAQQLPTMSLKQPQQGQVTTPPVQLQQQVAQQPNVQQQGFPSKFPAPVAAQQKLATPLKRNIAVALPKKDDRLPIAPVGMSGPAPINLPPNVTTTVQLSSSDVNRITCSVGEIKDIVTSDEKGLQAKKSGRDAFLKFKVLKQGDGDLAFSTTPTEVYVICGEQTYSMIAMPSRLPAQTINLSGGKNETIKANQEILAGLSHEKKILRVLKEAFMDEMPETYTISNVQKVDNSWEGIKITHARNIDIEGEGIRVKEYWVSLKPGKEKFRLTEKLFLTTDFTLDPIAISLDKRLVKPGERARVMIMENRVDGGVAGLAKMPALDVDVATPAETAKDTKPAASSQIPMFGNVKPGGMAPAPKLNQAMGGM